MSDSAATSTTTTDAATIIAARNVARENRRGERCGAPARRVAGALVLSAGFCIR